jgi:lipoprotein-anchoring transpeptidase ErfK/SrfK
MKTKVLILIAVAAIAFAGFRVYQTNAKPKQLIESATVSSKKATTSVADKVKSAAPKAANHCAGNATGNTILVDTASRHLWACEGTTTVYDTSVITGYSGLASTITPVGTYKIYGKQLDQTLKGSDAKGSWDVPVSYWEPFLSNQYGIYGFHDANWRDPAQFGTLPDTSKDASHGCVELPLAAMKWLYNWSQVGTTLTVS